MGFMKSLDTEDIQSARGLVTAIRIILDDMLRGRNDYEIRPTNCYFDDNHWHGFSFDDHAILFIREPSGLTLRVECEDVTNEDQEESSAARDRIPSMALGPVEALRRLLDSEYRMALQYGYAPPLVALRAHGDIERDETFGVTALAVNPQYFCEAARQRGYPERAAALRDRLEEVPSGYFLLAVVDENKDYDEPLYVDIPIPDQN